MKIVIAPDKFKSSLSAEEVCSAIAEGIERAGINAVVRAMPMGDGGEGTCAILTKHAQGQWQSVETVDPLQRPVVAQYGISRDGSRAFIEMASASGLQLLNMDERDPLRTSTLGTGIMIRHALESGASEIVLGVGGSATNDCGIGIASAFGYTFLDAEGEILSPTGASLPHVGTIIPPKTGFVKSEVMVLCDVRNPLFGRDGAAYVFAPQKGADDSTVRLLDKGLMNVRNIIMRDFGVDVNFPGAGAGGGVGAGLSFFLGGRIVEGIDYVMDVVGIEHAIADADLVISGEGKLDRQSLSGKVVSGVARVCATHKRPLLIITGRDDLGTTAEIPGNVRVVSLTADGVSDIDAINNARQLISSKITVAINDWMVGGGKFGKTRPSG
ncbi:MAG TPA: glycerate kinase [Ohtaekwangia sp.]|nr:glycerate kinase [Ohtaekwangia sp.]